MGKILHLGGSGLSGKVWRLRAVAAAAVLAGTMATTSCVKRDLYVKPDEGSVMLDLNWQQLASGEVPPENMAVYFYGDNGSLVRGKTENNHLSAVLPTGKYKILAVNEDVEGVAFSNMEEFDKAYAYALPVYGKTKEDVTSGWIRQPGWVYSGSLGDLVVNTGDTIQRTLMPAPLVQRVTLKIQLTGDVDAVTSVSGALTGVAPSVRLASGVCGDGYASITGLDPKPLDAAGNFTADVLVFGVEAKNEDGTPASNTVQLELGFTNGGSQSLEQDVTGGGINDPTHIEINIDINIDVSSTSAAGFTARVTKWTVTTGGMDVDNRPGGKPLRGIVAAPGKF